MQDASKANGRHPALVLDLELLSASPERAEGVSQLLHRSQDFLQRFVDYGITHTSLDRRSMRPVTAVMGRVRAEVEAVLWEMRRKYWKPQPYLIVERLS